jgi:hypothetical protein
LGTGVDAVMQRPCKLLRCCHEHLRTAGAGVAKNGADEKRTTRAQSRRPGVALRNENPGDKCPVSAGRTGRVIAHATHWSRQDSNTRMRELGMLSCDGAVDQTDYDVGRSGRELHQPAEPGQLECRVERIARISWSR